MSKNFELLYQMGKAQSVLQSETESVIARPLAEISSPPASSASLLKVDGMAREELTKLVHKLFLLPGAESPRHVVFTGTEAGNGCTWVCAHAAQILALQSSISVCVVDCNLRAPGLHRQFSVENHHGLADALLGDAPIRHYAQPLSQRNLWLVSCGAYAGNAQELLISDRMRARISELRAEFDCVLMDVAPLNACNHGMVLGGLSEGVVLVLKANSSRRDPTREIMHQLQAANVRLLGAVLNQRTFPIPDGIYNRL